MTYQTRRAFLAGLITYSANLPTNQASAEEIKYPLKTVQDTCPSDALFCSMILFDSTRAAKAKKLAEYVIKEEKLPLKYDTRMSVDSLMQVVEVKLVTEGIIYNLRVMNYDKRRRLEVRDSIMIKSRKNGARENEATTVQDRGLDGRCDYGVFPKSAKEKDAHIRNADFDLEWSDRGLEHQRTFQATYEKNLDTLIRFYERKTK